MTDDIITPITCRHIDIIDPINLPDNLNFNFPLIQEFPGFTEISTTNQDGTYILLLFDAGGAAEWFAVATTGQFVPFDIGDSQTILPQDLVDAAFALTQQEVVVVDDPQPIDDNFQFDDSLSQQIMIQSGHNYLNIHSDLLVV